MGRTQRSSSKVWSGSFGNIKALDGISFTAEHGGTYGCLDTNGAAEIPDHVRPVTCCQVLAIPLRVAPRGSTTGITGG